MRVVLIKVFSILLSLSSNGGIEAAEECGKVKGVVQNRIINGIKADNGEFIWMVHLVLNHYACGGTIITRKWVMTAAHCLRSVNEGDLSKVVIVMKQWGMPLQNTTKEQRIPVVQALRHPQYRKYFHNDIALLQAAKPLDIDNIDLGRICLPVIDIDFHNKIKLTVIGWGARDPDHHVMSEDLMKVNLTYIPVPECKQAYEKLKQGKYIRDTNICTREKGKDACQGDSGGPLFLEVNGRFVQVGIVSGGSKECANPNWPGFYTRVSKYMSWIKQVTGSDYDYKNLLETKNNPLKTTTPKENSTTTSKSSHTSCSGLIKYANLFLPLITFLYIY
jgi:secreted trypsin-like serine protease